MNAGRRPDVAMAARQLCRLLAVLYRPAAADRYDVADAGGQRAFKGAVAVLVEGLVGQMAVCVDQTAHVSVSMRGKRLAGSETRWPFLKFFPHIGVGWASGPISTPSRAPMRAAVSGMKGAIRRAVCRRAERSCISLVKTGDEKKNWLPYLNRLSDFLFVLVRYTNQIQGVNETLWVR